MSKHSALNNFGRSGNPAFRNHFDSSQTASNTSVRNPSYQNHFEANQSLSEGTMSLDGTVNKTGILLANRIPVLFTVPSRDIVPSERL